MLKKPDFGAMLRQRRKALDLTQLELADRVGCSSSTIRMVESGERRASRQLAELLARELNIAPDEREAFLQAARASTYASQEHTAADTTGPGWAMPDLPVYLTPLIGREQEIQAIEDRLLNKGAGGGVRLLTLVGPAGIGKTRLAARVAADSEGQFSAGVCFVTLATVREPEVVISTIAGALGVREQAEHSTDALLNALKKLLLGKEMLLVLDNMEQVVKSGPLIAAMLGGCPTVKALVTSREPLRVQGESVFVVPPLLLPSIEKLPPIETLLDCPAVALFVQRAQASVSNFALTETNALEVATICARMDGLPLAIELVAARVKLFPPRALLARLVGAHGQEAFRLLEDGSRDLPERHRTLQDAIRWSYDLLSEHEQTLFRRLSVFVGGCTLPAIEAVCNAMGDMSFDTIKTISSLLDKSLLNREYAEGGAEEPRFHLLEMVREYANLQLEAQGQTEADNVRLWHAEYYLALAEAAAAHRADPTYKGWLDRLEREHNNLRAALGWSLEKNVELAARLSGSLWLFWEVRSYVSEGDRRLGLVLAKRDRIPPLTRAKVLRGAGWFASTRGDYERALALLEESLALFRELGDKESVIRVLNNLSQVLLFRGDFSRADTVLDESLALARELADRACLAKSLHMRAWGASDQGEHSKSAALLEESIALSYLLGDKLATAYSLHNLALSVMALGQHSRARELLEESLALFDEQGDKLGVTSALMNLGWLSLESSEYEVAEDLLHDGLVLLQELGDNKRIAEYLEAFAGLSMALKQPERAAYLLGAAQQMRKVVGAPVPPRMLNRYEQIVAAVRSALREPLFARAWARGSDSSAEQAIACALEGSTKRP